MADVDPVAVLGAGGTMGYGMARNLARAGVPVMAWDRTHAKAEPLAQDGARICSTPSEAAAGARVILTMLADADAVVSAMQGEHGALADVGEDSLWLQMSTIGQRGPERCMELVTNSWLVAVAEGGAQTIALAEGLGLAPALFFEAIDGGALDVPYLQMKARRSPNATSRHRSRSSWPPRMRGSQWKPPSAASWTSRSSRRSASGWSRASPSTAIRT